MKAPGEWTVKKLFAGRPGPYRLYLAVRRHIATLGPIKAEATKTQVSFGAKRKFAWVWLPQMWVKAPEGSITLAFAYDRRIRDRRVKDAVEPRKKQWTHHVVVLKESDFDVKVKGWLGRAYALAKE